MTDRRGTRPAALQTMKAGIEQPLYEAVTAVRHEPSAIRAEGQFERRALLSPQRFPQQMRRCPVPETDGRVLARGGRDVRLRRTRKGEHTLRMSTEPLMLGLVALQVPQRHLVVLAGEGNALRSAVGFGWDEGDVTGDPRRNWRHHQSPCRDIPDVDLIE